MLRPIRNILIVLFVLAITTTTVSSQTNDITVTWDPNDPSEQVSEYRLYYKTDTSGPPYNGTGLYQGDSPIIILVNNLADEDNPLYSLTGLNSGVTYRFAITAYNGAESDYSNEVSFSFHEPTDLVDELAVDFGSFGIWKFGSASWSHVFSGNPINIVGWAGGLAVDFGPSGLWNVTSSGTWSMIHSLDVEGMQGWSNGLVLDFGPSGLWNVTSSGTWSMIHSLDVEGMQG